MSANMTDILVGLEQAKAEILERAAAVDPPHGDLLRRYYRHVAAEDLFDRDPEELLAAVLAHRELAVHRPQGRVLVRVTTAEADDADVRAQHTVVEVVCDDMPFLVDSVTAELSRHGRAIHLVIHPQLVVRRDVTGQLLDAAIPRRPPPRSATAPSSSPGCTSRSTGCRTRRAAGRSPRTSTGCSATSGRPSRTGRRCSSGALQIADEIEADARRGTCPPRRCRGDRAAALAGRRALHLPRLPRVLLLGRRR